MESVVHRGGGRVLRSLQCCWDYRSVTAARCFWHAGCNAHCGMWHIFYSRNPVAFLLNRQSILAVCMQREQGEII